MVNIPVQKYREFAELGFPAGVIHKGPWDDPGEVYGFLKTDIAPEGIEVISPVQVHSPNVMFIGNGLKTGEIVGDGVVCRDRGYCLTIKTADCLPLLFADPESGIFGAVHIGWRGLLGGIIENLYLALKNLDISFGRLYNSLGPAIGSCCYEVGAEVAVLFDDRFVTSKNSGYYLDIRGAVKEKLEEFGIGGNQLLDIAECTSCRAEKYYSFRRDGQARIQMASFIYKM